jgi:hypothetical protein
MIFLPAFLVKNYKEYMRKVVHTCLRLIDCNSTDYNIFSNVFKKSMGLDLDDLMATEKNLNLLEFIWLPGCFLAENDFNIKI